MGDRQSSELLSQSINTISTLQEDAGEQRKLLASSPACHLNASTATSTGRETTLSIPEIKGPSKQCQISALVFVKLQQPNEVKIDVTYLINTRFLNLIAFLHFNCWPATSELKYS